MSTFYYLEASNDSDIGGYFTLATVDNGNAFAPVLIVGANSAEHPSLMAEFITDPGVPGAMTMTAVYGFLVHIRAETDILSTVFTLRADLMRYKTTGTIASTTAVMSYHPSPKNSTGERDYIMRSGGSFITDGFTVGCRIEVSGTSGYNDDSYVVDGVTHSTLTLEPGSRLTDHEQISSTITTKEKLLDSAFSAEFSGSPEDLDFTNSGDIEDETFAADDRIVLKVWAQRERGASDAALMVDTEYVHPAYLEIS